MIILDDQIRCIEREIAMRKRCYPKWVERNSMSASQAAHEMNAMTEVLHTLNQVRQASLSVGTPK